MKQHLRIVGRLLVLNLIVSAPFLVISLAGWSGALVVAVFGLMVAASATLVGGFRFAVEASLALAIGGALGVVLRDYPWAAGALLIILGALYGWYASKGWGGGALLIPALVPYFMEDPPPIFSTAPPEVTAGYLAALALLVAGSGIWAAFLLSKVTHGKTLASSPLPTSQTVGYGAVLGLVAAGVVVVALLSGTPSHWAWITLTVFVLANPSGKLDRKRFRDRLIGTVAGFLLAVLILATPLSQFWLVVAALLLVTVALTLRLEGRPYWAYVSLLTPAVVLLVSIGRQADVIAVERLAFTFMGAVLAIVTMALTNYLYGRLHRSPSTHTRTSATDAEAQSVSEA